MDKNKMTFSFSCDKNLIEEVRAEALATGTKISWLISNAVRKELDNRNVVVNAQPK